MPGALEWNTGEGQTAHPRATSDCEHTFNHTRARALFANVVKCLSRPHRSLSLSEDSLPLPLLLLGPSLPCPDSLPDKRVREREEGRKEHHISQSQRCIGDIGTWQPSISHKHLPARPVPSAPQSPPPLHVLISD